jgi:N4-gp56 family major capsid protein
LKKISWTGLVGKRSDALIQWKDGLSKKPGDTETIGLRMQLTNAPKTSSDVVENNEQTLTLYDTSYSIDEVVDAVKFKNVIDRQRVTFDMRDEAKAALADQLANAWDTSFFNQIAGFNETGLAATFRGNNAVNAPSTNRFLLVGAPTNTAETDLDSGDPLTLDYIDYCVEYAKTSSPQIRPANISGFDEPLYVFFIHPFQNTQMRAADTRWDKTMRDAMQGGITNKNPLITGACGIWNRTLIVESNRVPTGLNSGVALPEVYRAIFCGAQTAVMGWGRLGGDPNRFRWVEKQFDYDREYGVMAGFLGGLSKLIFNGEDFGCIVVSSYGKQALT